MAAMNPASNVQILPEENESRVDLLDNQKMASFTFPVEKSELEQSQTTPLKRTYTSITDEVIDADPISYRLPDHVAIIRIPKVKNGSPSGESTSRSRKVTHTKTPPEWLENWNCQFRERSNGRFDKYYYHKEKGTMCRSLKEVERYEKQGISPRRKGKEKEKRKEKEENSIKEETEEILANEKEREAETEEIFASEKEREAKIQEMLAIEKKRAAEIEEMLANEKEREAETQEILANEKKFEAETREMVANENERDEENMQISVEEFLADAENNPTSHV